MVTVRRKVSRKRPPPGAIVLGFHFAGRASRYPPFKLIPPAGEWWKLTDRNGYGKLKRIRCCRYGLHASKHPADAYTFARQGDDLCLVEVRYVKDVRSNKFAGRWRRILCRMPRPQFDRLNMQARRDARGSTTTWADNVRNYRKLLRRYVIAEFAKARKGHTGRR